VGDDRTVPTDEFNFQSFEGELVEQHTAQGRQYQRWWILLSNQSTVDVFCNLICSRTLEAPTRAVTCNAGIVTVKMIGDLSGYPACVVSSRRSREYPVP
jgi:hypothetical protein